MADIDPILMVSELPGFLHDLEVSLRAYLPLLGFDDPLHVVHHNGEFGEAEIQQYSMVDPVVVFSLGGGEGTKLGGEAAAELVVSLFVITRDMEIVLDSDAHNVGRDLVALWLVGELLRFALRREDWVSQIQGTKVPSKVSIANLYSDSIREMNIALWSLMWSHTVLIDYQRDVTKLDTFATMVATFGNLPPNTGADETTLNLPGAVT